MEGYPVSKRIPPVGWRIPPLFRKIVTVISHSNIYEQIRTDVVLRIILIAWVSLLPNGWKYSNVSLLAAVLFFL